MRCGEIAARVNVSPDTIRHYERIGLLKAPPRTSGGYRNYPPETLKRVQLIRRALGAGFTLQELAEILKVRDAGGTPCRSVLATAGVKLKQVEAQIAELKAARRQLDSILKDWRKRLAKVSKGKPARLLENLPEQLEEHHHANAKRAGYRSVRRNFGLRRGGVRPAGG